MMVREPPNLSRVIQLGNMSYHIVVVNLHADPYSVVIVSCYLPMLILLLCLCFAVIWPAASGRSGTNWETYSGRKYRKEMYVKVLEII